MFWKLGTKGKAASGTYLLLKTSCFKGFVTLRASGGFRKTILNLSKVFLAIEKINLMKEFKNLYTKV